MQSGRKGSSYSITKLSYSTPVQYGVNSEQLPDRIKVEKSPQEDIHNGFAKLIAKYQIKRENVFSEPTQTLTNEIDGASFLLATNVSSLDSGEESTFVDEIEIGETTIASQFGENAKIKMEYSSHDEGSLEQQFEVEMEDQTTECLTRTMDVLKNQSLPFKCENCDALFCNVRQLNNHRRNHQLEMCPICKKTIIARYLKEHIALNHPKSDALLQKRIYKCNQCEKLFYCKTLLIDHQRNHQTKECPFCKQMVKLRVLNMHIARKHSAHVSRREASCTFSCDQCDKSFASKPLLVDHQRDHRSKNCPVCSVKVLARCLKKHMARKHPSGGSNEKVNQSYICDHCDKTFSNKRSFIAHLTKHQQVDEGTVI